MSDLVDQEVQMVDRESDENSNEVDETPLRALQSDPEDDDEAEENHLVADLIDDNPVEDNESSDEDEGRQGKRKKNDDGEDENSELEDDDYDLIEENLGVKLQRKKFKRVRRIADDDSEEETAYPHGTDREVIANQLFAGSDHEEEREEPTGRRDSWRDATTNEFDTDGSAGEESDPDDFIVDDQDRPIRESRLKRRPVFSEATLQAAQDIFGVEFDYQEFQTGEVDREDDESEGEDVGDERGVSRRSRGTKKTSKAKSILEVFEPHELERAGITREDDKIRLTDIPERMQLRRFPLMLVDDDDSAEVEEEAKWILREGLKDRVNMLVEEAVKRAMVEMADVRVPNPIPRPASSARWQEIGDDHWANPDTRSEVFTGPAESTVSVRDEENNPCVPPPAATLTGWDDGDWDTPPPAPVVPAPPPQRDHQQAIGTSQFTLEMVKQEPPTEESFEDPPAAPVPFYAGSNSDGMPAYTNSSVVQCTIVPTMSAEGGALDEPETFGDCLMRDGHLQAAEEVPSISRNSETTFNDFAVPAHVAPRRADHARPPESSWEDESTVGEGRASSSVVSYAQSPNVNQEKILEEISTAVLVRIKCVIRFFRKDRYEVPFIAFHKKEFISPELTINHLWKIYKMDAQFCQLRQSKLRLAELYKSVKNHIDELYEDASNTAAMDLDRRITDEDIQLVESVQNPTELRDMQLYFSLYYSDYIYAVKENLVRKRKEEDRRRKLAEAEYEKKRAAETDKNQPQQQTDINIAENEATGEEDANPEIEEDGFTEESTVKRKGGGGAYGMCKKYNVRHFVKLFGLTVEKFAENMQEKYARHPVFMVDTSPLEAAAELCSERLKTAEEVVKAAIFMMATQIAREPSIRRLVRKVFFNSATLSCWPTKKGHMQFDESHPLFTMKYLKDKPVRKFAGSDQFLRLALAEGDGLLVISIGEDIRRDISSKETYVEEIKKLFHRDEFSNVVVLWNKLRQEVVELAFEKMLYPELRKELRTKLLEDAKACVVRECGRVLFEAVKIAPYQVSYRQESDQHDEWTTKHGLRVLSIAYNPEFERACACLITPEGEPLLTEYLDLRYLVRKNQRSLGMIFTDEKENDVAEIKKYIARKKPHVIVIGGESREALAIQVSIQNAVEQLVEEEDYFPKLEVEIVDNELAKVYGNSLQATLDFPDYPNLARQAVSLGRRMQDPLTEFVQLCNADNEILNLRMDTLQDHVSKEELLEHFETILVNRVNEVGVDFNKAVMFPHVQKLLQFVGGLGPSKASGLVKAVKQTNKPLENRLDLKKTFKMGPCVFANCAGFIKLDTDSLADSEGFIEILDSTRIHPSMYEHARMLAMYAIRSSPGYTDDEFLVSTAVEDVIEDPTKLRPINELVLQKYNQQYFMEEPIGKMDTLRDILNELAHRHPEMRSRYIRPEGEALFYMLMKESPEAFYNGKLVTAVVTGFVSKRPPPEEYDAATPIKVESSNTWQCQFCGKNDFRECNEVWPHYDTGVCPGKSFGIHVKLDNGMLGFIPNDKLSDKQVERAYERVKIGQIIHCRVTNIDLERFSVVCTCKTSDLMDSNGEFRREKDEYYDKAKEQLDLQKSRETQRRMEHKSYVKRVVVHPSFRNVTYKDAEELMKTMDQGEVIIRPSSKGANRLTVTWKVADGICQHIDVLEEGKESTFSLGQTLYIDTEEFEDLDEIVARHVNPMAALVRDVMSFKYFVPSIVVTGNNLSKTEDYLFGLRLKNPNKIHYIITISRDFPGKFLLSYLPKLKCMHEFITVTPEGLRFRGNIFDDLTRLFEWFKEHYREAY